MWTTLVVQFLKIAFFVGISNARTASFMDVSIQMFFHCFSISSKIIDNFSFDLS